MRDGSHRSGRIPVRLTVNGLTCSSCSRSAIGIASRGGSASRAAGANRRRTRCRPAATSRRRANPMSTPRDRCASPPSRAAITVGGAERRASSQPRSRERALRSTLASRRDADVTQFAHSRRTAGALLRELAAARAETARYRQLVVDLENNAPPPLLDGPTRPTTSSSSSASARCSSACCTSSASRPIGRSRAGASATSTSSMRSCPSFRAASAATLGHAGARAAPAKFGEPLSAMPRRR